MPKLTIVRTHPKDPIHINVHVFNPASPSTLSRLIPALFDTGAAHTVISAELAGAVGLTTTGHGMVVHGVTGSTVAQAAWITIGIQFDAGQTVTIENLEVPVVDQASDHVLIGRDFLERFDVTISRAGGFTLEC